MHDYTLSATEFRTFEYEQVHQIFTHGEAVALVSVGNNNKKIKRAKHPQLQHFWCVSQHTQNPRELEPTNKNKYSVLLYIRKLDNFSLVSELDYV